MGAGAPGMFPVMQPGMWNVLLNQWSQFYGNQQFPPSTFNPMMMIPLGSFNPMVPQTSNSQGSSVGLNNSSQQEKVSGGSKNKKKNQKPHSSDGNKINVDKGGNNGIQLVTTSGLGPIFDPKFKDVICYNCGEPGHYVGL
jgi:hypothetical protein